MSEVGVFSEDNGNTSAMRVMCFMSLLASMGFGTITLTMPGANAAQGVYITMAFLLGAFAPKALQKFSETKIS